jgi:glucokinase
MNDAMTDAFAVGLDIGGTSVVGAILAREDARIVARRTIPSNSQAGIEDGLTRLAGLVSGLMTDAGLRPDAIAGIGIGSSGPIDAAAGTIHNPFTLPGWEGIPVVEHLSRRFEVPACLIGDCQIAALGEHWNGAGRGAAGRCWRLPRRSRRPPPPKSPPTACC